MAHIDAELRAKAERSMILHECMEADSRRIDEDIKTVLSMGVV